jgi:hypothetical protein
VAETDARGPDRQRWVLRNDLRDALALFVSLRIAFGIVAIYLWWPGTLPTPCHFELARNGWTTIPPLADQDPGFALVGVWQRWDACWYTKIATFGYEATENSANFWPLFPLLTGILGRVFLGAMAFAGMVVSGIAYVAAMAGLQRLVARDFDSETARRAILLISVFPTAFFLFAPFTESLFLALAVWAILAARERRWWLAAACALLASLTRIQGVFLVLPLAWELVASRGGLAWRPGVGSRAALRAWLPGTAAVLAPIAGFASFLLFTAAATGQTPLDTQDVWGGREFHPPWRVVEASWNWAIERRDPLQLLNLGSLLLFIVLTLVGLRRLPLSYTLFALPQIALLATRIQPTPLTSTARYLLVVFPAFVLLALVRQRHVHRAWVLASTLLLGVLFASFLAGNYVA